MDGLRPETRRYANAYNLEVADIHTYHVSDRDTLVHNQGTCDQFDGVAFQDPSLVADDIAMHADHRQVLGVPYEDLAGYLEDIKRTPGHRLRDTPSGTPRMCWWDEDSGTMIIREGNNGTFFQPDRGYQSFQEQIIEWLLRGFIERTTRLARLGARS